MSKINNYLDSLKNYNLQKVIITIFTILVCIYFIYNLYEAHRLSLLYTDLSRNSLINDKNIAFHRQMYYDKIGDAKTCFAFITGRIVAVFSDEPKKIEEKKLDN
jgi:hypothetical protein